MVGSISIESTRRTTHDWTLVSETRRSAVFRSVHLLLVEETISSLSNVVSLTGRPTRADGIRRIEEELADSKFYSSDQIHRCIAPDRLEQCSAVRHRRYSITG